MTRGNILTRLERLEEALKPPPVWRCHTIMGDTDEELSAREAELKASADWQEGDHLIAIRFVAAVNGRPA